MKRQVVRETLAYMWRNKKNRLVIVLCFGALLVHSLLILPNTRFHDEVDVVALERGMDSNRQTFEDRLEEGLTVPTFMTGTSAYEIARNEYVNQRELLTALKMGDVRRYLGISYRPTSEEREFVPEEKPFTLLGYAKEEAFQSFKNNYYMDEVEQLNFHIVHERTSLQQLHLFLIGQGPYVLIFLLLFMVSDVVTKDRKLRTQKLGVPVNWFTYVLVQSLTAMGFFLVFAAALAGFFILVNGLLYGFGTLNLPVGVFDLSPPEEGQFMVSMIVEAIGTYFVRVLPYSLLLMYGFTRLSSLFSLLVKHDVVVLILSVFVLMFPQLYYSPGTSELFGVSATWFPQTYFHFGEVASGRMALDLMTYTPYVRGLIVLVVTILVLELLNWIVSKKITRQAFIG